MAELLKYPLIYPLFQKCFFTIFLILGMPVYAEEKTKTVHFAVPDFKPYTYKEDGQFKGYGIEKIKQIFSHLDRDYTLMLVPNYGRAVMEVRQGRADGFLLASRNNERDAIAVFSQPVAINRWSWFIPKTSKLSPDSPSFKTQAQIVTHLNTNTHKWLKKNGYVNVKGVHDLQSLPKYLKSGHIDAVFLAEVVFVQLLQDYQMDMSYYHQVVELEKPMGIYISKNYLQAFPNFIDKLNQFLPLLDKP